MNNRQAAFIAAATIYSQRLDWTPVAIAELADELGKEMIKRDLADDDEMREMGLRP